MAFFHPLVSFERGISIAYWLGVFTLVILFPYIWNIINLLKPETIISRLATDVTKDSLLNAKEDPIQPIMDIVHGSIMKYDIATTRVGLRAVTDRVIDLIDSQSKKEISERFCKHLERVGRLAISRDDEESAVEVIIKNLGKFGVSSTEKELTGAASTAVEFIATAGVTALKKDVAASWQAVDSLEAVGGVAAVKGHDGMAVHVARYLMNFGLSISEEDESMINKIVWALEDVGKKFVEYNLEKAPKQAAESLAELTIISEKNVRTAIQEYEMQLTEQDREIFQKFNELYEEELEKLRAEQQK